MALLQGGQGPVAGVELRGQGHQLEHRRQAEAGNARIGQLYPQVAGDKQQANEDERHGQLGADVGNGDDGGPQLDGQVVGGILDGVARLVGGHTDGGGGGVVVHRIGQADDIGAWVIVIGEVARHPFDADLVQPVGVQHHAGGICPGEAAHGELLGIFSREIPEAIASGICLYSSTKNPASRSASTRRWNACSSRHCKVCRWMPSVSSDRGRMSWAWAFWMNWDTS